MPIKVSVEQTGLERSIQNAAKQAGRNLKINLGTSARDVKSLEQPLGRITGQADEFGKSMEAANARVLAFGASVGIINAVVQSFKSLVSTTIEVEANLAKINSILQTTNSGLNALKNQIFDIARNTEQTFDTVADAALELSRQGLSATEVTKRLNDSLILSRLSGISAAEAVSGLTAAVNSFTKAGLTTGEVLNKISNAANQFAVSERDLIEGFKRSASVAELAGVSIDELGGIITAVQQKTARGGAVIGNSFKTIFTRIGRSENLELLSSLGVQITDIQGKILPATKLIENLAQQLDKLGDVEVREVTQKIGGGFQIAPLLAALSDYSSEASVAIQATEAFRNATDQAYKKNEALNKTLSAAINQTTLSVKELANALGELGVTDTFRTVLEFFNNLVQNAKSILDGEGLGGDFARGIVKGLGSVLVKGGLALFGALILKLSVQLGKFGINSLKTFLGLNKAAEQQKNIQQQIVGVLLSDESIRKQILNIENSSLSQEQKRLQQAQFFNTLLNERAAITSKLSGIAGGTAAILGGSSSTGKTSRSAGGFLPVGAEQKDISKGVGGAPSGAKPVVIPNFAFGGGERGTMVANSSEYIVPNFAGGGSAIFNQDMVKSMGLPSGARKISAAGGFIPNFARTQLADDKQFSEWLKTQYPEAKTESGAWSPAKALPLLNKKGLGLASSSQAQVNRLYNNPKLRNKWDSFSDTEKKSYALKGTQRRALGNVSDQESKYGIIYPDAIGGETTKDIKVGSKDGVEYSARAVPVATTVPNALYTEIREQLIDSAENYITQIGFNSKYLNRQGFREDVSANINEGSVKASFGTVFDSGFTGALGSKQRSNAIWDLPDKGSIQTLFSKLVKGSPLKQSQASVQDLSAADFKNTLSEGNRSSVLNKILNKKNTPAEFSSGSKKTKGSAAGGYIPNFAHTLGVNKDSIAIRSVTSPLDGKLNRKRGTGAVKNAIIDASSKAKKKGFNKITADIISDSSLGAFRKYFGRAKRGKNTWGLSEFNPRAAKGYIPNFAAGVGLYDSDYLQGSNKKLVLDQLLASKKRKDLLVAPAGAGKSTVTQKTGGKPILSQKDLAKFSRYLILSASGKGKNSLFTAPFQKILDSVKSSGGKIEYLYVSDDEIQKRRENRVAKGSIDPRDEKQLKGTFFAPKNQSAFMRGLGRAGATFTRGSEGYIPNFAGVKEGQKDISARVATVSELSAYRPVRQEVEKINKAYAAGKKTDKKAGKAVSSARKIVHATDKVYSPKIEIERFNSNYVQNLLRKKKEGRDKAQKAEKDFEVYVARKTGGDLTDTIRQGEGGKETGVRGGSSAAVDVIRSGRFVGEVKSGFADVKKIQEKFLRFPIENYQKEISKDYFSGEFSKNTKDQLRYKEGLGAKLFIPSEEAKKFAKDIVEKKRKGNAASGYIPNFAMSPLDDAINREKSAGVPVNQIRINQDGKLRNSQNPAGLAVTNTRDEPTGRIPNFINTGASREQLFPNSDFSSSGGSPKIDKGAEVSAGKLFALSSAAFALQSIFAGVGNETEGFTKNLSEAASGLIGLVTTVTLLQSIGQDPLKGGLIGGVGKLGKGAGGKFSAILNSIGKVGPGIVKTFSFLGKWGLKAVPILGQLLLGFQALSSIGSLFGKDLVGPIKDFGAKILSSVGFIATPAEKAAEGLKKLNEELFKERFGKGPVNVAELSIKRLELPRTKEGKAETDPLAALASKIKGTATGTQSRAFFKDVGVTSSFTRNTRTGEKVQGSRTDIQTKFFAPDINGKIKEINEETYNLFEATAEAAVIESTNAILNTLSQAKQQELLKDPKKLEQTIKEQRAKLEKEFGKEGLNSFDATSRQITQEEALLKTREGIAAKEGKDATPLLLANIEKSKETLTVLNKIRSLYLGYLIGDTKELTKQQKLEITRKTLVADVVKIQDKARFQNAITLAGLKTELEYRLEIQNSLQSTSQFQKEENKRQLDSLVFTKKRNIELAKSARTALEGNPAIQRSFKVEAGGKITPEQLKVYQQTVESISRAALEGEAITLGFIQEQLDLNGDILGNKEDVSAVIFATVEAQKSQLRIEEAQVNLARERATIQKIILDQEKRKLDLEASSFGKQSKRIQEAKELFNLEKDLQIKKIEGRAIGGSQGAQFNAKQKINKIEQQKIDKGLELDTKALTNSFRKSIFDAVSSAGFKNLLTGDNLEAIKQAEGSVGFDALINDLEKQAEVEEKRRINAASDEALKQLEILTQQKLIQNDFRTSVAEFSAATKINSAVVEGTAKIKAGDLSPEAFGKNIKELATRLIAGTQIDSKKRSSAIKKADTQTRLGIRRNRRDGLEGAGDIKFDVDFLSYVADFNKLVKGAELASQALINSLAESGASLTTFANLVRAEFNKISETRAQNAFTLATSADPSAIQGALSSDIRLNTLQGGLESGLSGAESIQKANELVALQQKQLDIVSARTGAEKISAQFELEKLRETLALRQEIAAIDPNDPKKSEKIFEIQKKIASIQTKSQSFSQKFQSEFYKTERQNVEELQDTIISGARRFSDTLASGLNDALVKGEDLGDVLTSAAFDFFNELSKKSIGQLLDKSISGIAGLFGFDPKDIGLGKKKDGSSPDSALFVKNASEAEKKVLKNSDDLKSILGEKTKRGYTSSAPLFVSIVSGSVGDLIGLNDIVQQKEKQKIPGPSDRAQQFNPAGEVGTSSVQDEEKQSQNFISKYFSNIAEKFGNVFSKFLSGFKSLLGFGGNASGNNTAQDGFGSTVGGALGSIFGPVGSQVGSFIGGLLPFNQGGYVEGGSGSKDDVPAMLMGGEYVMKKKSVNKYGSGFMEKLNNGKIKTFADGGLVGGATNEDSEEEQESSFLSDYVTKQNSISRFGKEFVDSIKGSGLQKFASGGLVGKEEQDIQRGQGGFFIPGTYGGTIQGKSDLLSFATQSFTSGARDTAVSGSDRSGGYAGVGLEAESVRLTNFGRKLGTPLQRATQDAKQQAFGVRAQQLDLEKQLKEQEKARKKALKNQLISAAISVAAGAAAGGFKLGAKDAGGLTSGFKDGIGAGLKQFGKGVFGGLKGSIFGDTIKGAKGTFGGLKNIFSARGGIGNDRQLLEYIQKNPDSSLAKNTDLFGTASSAFTVDSGPQTLAQAQRSSGFNYAGLPRLGNNVGGRNYGERAYGFPFDDTDSLLPRKRATGGYIPETTGVDTVPAMLSGGEFVMNSGAADRIGKGNLERMNSGVSDGEDSKGMASEELLRKFDDLIEATKESTGEINITVNGDTGREEEDSSGQNGDGNRQFAKKLKEEVVKIIEEEKRLGGSLRNDKL